MSHARAAGVRIGLPCSRSTGRAEGANESESCARCARGHAGTGRSIELGLARPTSVLRVGLQPP
eukprot:13702607-Alexandrium_andersonii.AAC.1